MLHRKPSDISGFTLVELLIAIAILGILAGIATLQFFSYLERARIARAKSDIKVIEKAVVTFRISNGQWPANLAEADADLKDPWGNPYRYQPVPGTPKGKLRKDRFLVPINSDFDLYSMGRDGKSQGPLTANASQDDIIRANNGGFVGLASFY
ncbi:MAG: type II secretion system protein GspG [Thermodesulfobacteriota bacterium]|nr:type II secretion system protein GspG [Thermodesulfobacteriota bacterium]